MSSRLGFAPITVQGMDLTPREIMLVFRLIVAAIFGGMSLLFWAVNRSEDARRLDRLKEMDCLNGGFPALPEDVTPLGRLRADFSALYGMNEKPRERGDLLVDVLNRLFTLGDVSVGCSFEKRCDESGKATEIIDGVIELDENLYLVEVNWQELPIGLEEVQEHVKLLSSGEEGSATRGVIISFTGFTEFAVNATKEALVAGHLVVLCTVADFANVVEGEGHVDALLRTRVHIAAAEKNPYASYC